MHQKIDQPWGMSVHGTGVVRAEPEIAQIAVAVDVVQAEADAAFADASTAVTRVREVTGAGAPSIDRSGGPMSFIEFGLEAWLRWKSCRYLRLWSGP